MMNRRKSLILGLAVIALLAAIALLDPAHRLKGWLRGERFFAGKPTSYWAGAIVARDPATQAEAIGTLADARAAATPVLCEVFRSHRGGDGGSASVRIEVMNLLSKAVDPDPGVTEVILQGITDPDPHVRTLAVKSLGKLTGPLPDEAIPTLVELLHAPDKVYALQTLSRFGPRAATAVSEIRPLLLDGDVDVRWNASRTLGKIGPGARAAVPDLLPHFNDPSEKVREHAAEAIGAIGPDAAAAIPALEGALTDKRPRVRRDAARSFGMLGEVAKGSLPKLLPLLRDPEEMVREAARKAIKLLDPAANVEDPPPGKGDTTPDD